jgi:hypothetical protein
MTWATQDTTIVGRRYSATCSSCGGQPCGRVMALEPFGAEYWVIRSQADLSSGSQDLVIRITPEGISRADNYLPSCGPRPFVHHDGRLMATVVTYTNQCDELWDHTAWADSVFGPQIVDVDSAGRALEFVIQGFGGTAKKAALVVLSLEDGPTSAGDVGWTPPCPEVWLPYRMSFALAKSPYPAPFAGARDNPLAFLQTSATEAEPAWSPDGTELAYASTELTPGRKILRRPVSGGSATKVYDVSEDQYQPDWSPRGDWIAFAQDSSSTLSNCRHILVKHVSTSEVRKLATGRVFCAWPAFQPNGQRLAYACQSRPDSADHSGWAIQRVNLDGSSATTLVEFAPGTAPDDRALRSLRWSAAGDSVFFTRNDSLFVVSADGGAASYRGGYVSGKNIRTFDLACANGAVAFEEPGAFTSSAFCTTAYHRIALADRSVTPPDIEARFYRTGAEYFTPRWSFDGTRLAYATIQDSASDRDIYVGQVNYDHPPQFVNAPRDTVLPSICSLGDYTRTFSASDADGEQVSFEGAYLPPAAALTANGQFSWPNPGPPGCEYYSVIRAKDGSGGVAQKVIKLRVAPDSVPPAAIADLSVDGLGRHTVTVSWTASGDDGLSGGACEYDLRFSTSPITAQNFGSATPFTIDPPDTAGTSTCAVVDGLDGCTTYYFALKTADDAGSWSAISNLPNGKTRCSGSTEVFCDEEGMMAQGGGAGGRWVLEDPVLEESAGAGAEPNMARREAALASVSPAGHSDRTSAWALGGAIASDTTELAVPLEAIDGRVSIRLSPRGSATWGVDGARVAVVDHVAGETALLGAGGVLVGTLSAPQAVSSGGTDLTPTVASGEDVVTGAAGSTWDVTLGGPTALLLEVTGGARAAAEPDSGISVLVPDGANGWQPWASLMPGPGHSQLVVDSIPAGRARLVFGAEQAVARLARFDVHATATLNNLALVSAVHSQAGSVLSALNADSEVVVHAGESLVLSYQAAAIDSGQARDYFLIARGRRLSATSPTGSRRTVSPPTTVQVPTSFALHQNQPNPFRGTTAIRFDVPVPCNGRLEVFDMQGRRVRTLADGPFSAGFQSVPWDQRDASGSLMKPGVYLYRLQAGTFRAQRKLVLLP